MPLQVDRHLLTDMWTMKVEALERALLEATCPDAIGERCRIAFSEVAHDPQLHVTIVKTRHTMVASGCAA